MGDHPDLAPLSLQMHERVGSDRERFGIQTAEALVDKQRLDAQPIGR